jgi:hypothetical protein
MYAVRLPPGGYRRNPGTKPERHRKHVTNTPSSNHNTAASPYAKYCQMPDIGCAHHLTDHLFIPRKGSLALVQGSGFRICSSSDYHDFPRRGPTSNNKLYYRIETSSEFSGNRRGIALKSPWK